MADGLANRTNSNSNEEDEKEIFCKVLEDVVKLNSLFSVAVFIGLSLAQPGPVQSLEDDTTCNPDTNVRKRLVAFEIASFSCFVFSSLLAKAVKVFLYIHTKKEFETAPHRQGKCIIGFYMSIYGTLLGSLLLLLAMVDVVQIKLGRLSCYSVFTIGTASAMVGTIGLSLLIYCVTATYGLKFATFKGK